MKTEKNVHLSNKIKEIVMKTLIVLGFVFLVGGLVTACFTDSPLVCGLSIGLGMGISFICIISIFIIGSTCVEEKNEKDYVIKHYDCQLDTAIEERMKLVYDKVKHFKLNPENYYSAYICGNEMKIFVVMTVRSDFCESEFVAFMEEIPELYEKVIEHTLVVVFIEAEKSEYLKEIMYTPEYNELYKTKVYAVYDESAKKLKVNKTDSGMGNKAYNRAKRELDKVFMFADKKIEPAPSETEDKTEEKCCD